MTATLDFIGVVVVTCILGATALRAIALAVENTELRQTIADLRAPADEPEPEPLAEIATLPAPKYRRCICGRWTTSRWCSDSCHRAEDGDHHPAV